MRVATAMTIAGSDSCGGAGVQADLKTMSAFGVHGTSALTSITAQNTLGVRSSFHLPTELIAEQIDAIMDDMGAQAAKTGMLATVEIIETVADRIRSRSIPNVVVDPVMVATSGARLMDEKATDVFVRELLPLALVITPNVDEAAVLAGFTVDTRVTMMDAARAICDVTGASVLVKGGHMTGDATDILFDGAEFHDFTGRRIEGGRIHGTGCTLAAAIASGLARGDALVCAIEKAKDFVTRGIEESLDIGRGSALINHTVHAAVIRGSSRMEE